MLHFLSGGVQNSMNRSKKKCSISLFPELISFDKWHSELFNQIDIARVLCCVMRF